MRTTISLAALFCGLTLALAQTPTPPAEQPAWTTSTGFIWEKMTDLPWVIPAAELPEDFRAYHMVIRGEGDATLTNLFMTGMMMTEADAGMSRLMQLSNFYWMRPEVPFGATWVYAYRLDLGDIFTMLGGMAGATSEEGFKLRLHRIKIEDISVFSARPDFTRADLLAGLAGAGATAQAAGPRTEAEARSQTLSNAQQVAMGLIMYATDHDDVFPFVQSTAGARELTVPYFLSPDLWATFNPIGGRFLMSMAVAGVRMTDIEDPRSVPLLYESTAWPDGARVVAFADGRRRLVNAEEWTQIEPLLRARLPKTGRPLPADLGARLQPPRARVVPAAVG